MWNPEKVPPEVREAVESFVRQLDKTHDDRCRTTFRLAEKESTSDERRAFPVLDPSVAITMGNRVADSMLKQPFPFQLVLRSQISLMFANVAAAGKPADTGYPAEWWRDALLSLLWVVPNRIEAALSLRWEHMDLDSRIILTTARSTKQKRDHRACLPPVVAEKLRRIKQFSPMVFPWRYGESTLYRHFFKIETAAGIKLTCTGEHDHTEACHFYGFHGYRRSFATLNDELPASMKQGQMGHSSYAMTQRYERYADSRANFASKIYLPPSMTKAAAGG